MVEHSKKFYLIKSLNLAKQRLGFCSPNPAVGAVIVGLDGKVLSYGYHEGPGKPHAEIEALDKLKYLATGATIYVTLEPCCHYGRTPPCTRAIIASGIKRVVYGYQDPNPIVAGQGVKQLIEAGIECEYIFLKEIEEFYESYSFWHQHKIPFVTAKIAMSLDGKIAGGNNQSIKLTGHDLDIFTHEQRRNHDAILTTATTVNCDNPRLNVRLGNETYAKPLYVLDRELKISKHSTIFSSASSVTLFHSEEVGKNKIIDFVSMGICCIPIKEVSEKLFLEDVLKKIGEDGFYSLWVEAGGKCFSSFIKENLLQKILIYISPKLLGKGVPAFDGSILLGKSNEIVEWKQYGHDMLCEILVK